MQTTPPASQKTTGNLFSPAPGRYRYRIYTAAEQYEVYGVNKHPDRQKVHTIKGTMDGVYLAALRSRDETIMRMMILYVLWGRGGGTDIWRQTIATTAAASRAAASVRLDSFVPFADNIENNIGAGWASQKQDAILRCFVQLYISYYCCCDGKCFACCYCCISIQSKWTSVYSI